MKSRVSLLLGMVAIWCSNLIFSSAFAQVLDDVDMESADGQVTLHVSFSKPVQYLRRFPESRGQTLIIYLRVIGPADGDNNIRRRISKKSELDGEQLFRDITYDPNSSEGTRLVVRFTKTVSFKVQQGLDNRGIDITYFTARTTQRKNGAFEKKAESAAVSSGRQYVINLESSISKIKAVKPLPKSMKKYRIYTTSYTKSEGKWYSVTWHRLRMGFFDTKEEAERVLRDMRAHYPAAWIDLAPREEIRASVNSMLVPGFLKATRKPKIVSEPTPKQEAVPLARKPKIQAEAKSGDPLEALFKKGKRALTKGDNLAAIRAFTKVLEQPNNKYSQESIELLGLARERNGQANLAKVEYKLYLKLYPQGEGAERVRLRLDNLEGITRTEKLRKSKRKTGVTSQVYGSWSQIYYRGNSKIDTSDISTGQQLASLSAVDQSALISSLDVTARYRNEHMDSRFVFSGDYDHDFLDNEDEGQIRSAYADIQSRSRKYVAKVGRQRGRGGGVLGRFDGGIFGYRFLPKWRLNALVGEPVDNVAQGSERQFQGVGFDLGTFAGSWSSSIYLFEQDIDSMIDRKAVGAELRYFDKSTSVFSALDYDTYFGELNIFYVQGSWKASTETTYNVLFDYRQNPPLQTSNALLGANADSINGLLAAGNSEEQIKQLALDRTAISEVLSVGAVHPLNKKLQVGADIILTDISGLPESGIDPGIDPNAAEGYQPATDDSRTTSLTAKLIGTGLFTRRDVSVFGLSYIDGDDYKADSAFFTERLSIGRSWRIDFSLKWYQQDQSTNKLTRLTPALKIDYQRDQASFEFEYGQEREKTRGTLEEEVATRDFVTLGYRWDF